VSIEVGSGRPTTADERLAGILRSELMTAKEMLKSIINVLRGVGEAEEAELKRMLKEIGEGKRRIELLQREFLDYFSRVAPSLYNREEWMGMFAKISGIVDKLSGIAYRAEYLASKSWRLPRGVREALVELASSLLSIIDQYLLMMNVALSEVDKALEARRRIALTEAEIDSRYRRATFAILDAPISAPCAILLLYIAEMLEDVSDLVNSVADDLYLVALSSA